MLGKLLGRLNRHRQPETNSGIPIEGATQAPPPLTIEQMIQRYIRTEVSADAADQGEETFEEADDFEPDEDEDVLPLTHHQVMAMTDDELRGVAASYGIELTHPSTTPTGASGGPELRHPSTTPTGSSGAPEAPAVGTSPPTG